MRYRLPMIMQSSGPRAIQPGVVALSSVEKHPVSSMVKRPGNWNRFTITCKDNMIWILLNGKQINEMDMSLFTDAKVNPDGSPAPSWLSNPPAELPTKGYVGLQGKHAGAPVWFRNLKIKSSGIERIATNRVLNRITRF